MIRINAQRAMTPAQLAALYAGDPRQADASLFTGSAQAHGFVQDQARQMGVSDPVQFFNQQRAQQQMANTPSLPAQLTAREMGAYTPGTLPFQLQQRDSLWDRSATQSGQQQAQLATLQNQRALTATPLPNALGDMPNAAPDSFAAQTGMDPAQYAYTKRLGGMQEGNQFIRGGGMIDTQTLTDDPRFSALMTQHPEKAAHVFSALTGGDLKTHLTTVTAQRKDQERFGLDSVQDWAKSGRMSWDKDKGWRMRQLVSDPMDASGQRMMLGSEYGAPDPFQQELINKHGPQVAPFITEQSRVAARVAQHERTRAAIPQTTQSANGAPEVDPLKAHSSSQLGYHLGEGMMAEGMLRPAWDATHIGDPQRGMDARAMGMNALKGVGNLMGGNWAASPYQNADPNLARVPQGQHVRTSQLIQNPRFQELLRTDPASARRIIAAMQQGGGL